MEIEGTHKAIAKAEKKLAIKNLVAEMRGYPRLTLKFGRLKKGVMEARFKKARNQKR